MSTLIDSSGKKIAVQLHGMRRHLLCFALAGPLALVAAGCGGREYEIADVDGVVLIKGRPGDKLRVEFAPDGAKGGKGPTSTAETDEQGRFKLRLFERDASSPQAGAVVGWHRVVLTDRRLSESATGRGVTMRLAPEYTLVGSTPLSQEVKPGKQTIELLVP